MRGKKIFVAVAVLALVAVACRSSGGPSSRGDVQTDVGVAADGTITLGSLAALTDIAAPIGIPLQRGHEVYWQYVNDELGGVGRNLSEDQKFSVELETLDTKYNVETHKQQYAKVKDQVLMIAQSFGTPTTQTTLQDIRDDELLTAPASLASAWLREKYTVPAGAPYPVQTINALAYVVNELGVTPKVGIIYQDDDYGEEGLKGLEYAADKLGFEIVARATYKLGDSRFGTQVGAMQRAGADYVVLTSIPSATGPILGAALALEYTPQWIGNSPTWIGVLAQSEALLPYLQAYYWVATDASCAWGATGVGCEGMEEMVANLDKYGGDQGPDYYFQFGYTQARVVHQILERAIELGDLTRAGVVTAFESLSDVDMGGLLNPISYGPNCEDKVPVTGTTIFGVNPDEPIALEEVATHDDPIVNDFPFCA